MVQWSGKALGGVMFELGYDQCEKAGLAKIRVGGKM